MYKYSILMVINCPFWYSSTLSSASAVPWHQQFNWSRNISLLQDILHLTLFYTVASKIEIQINKKSALQNYINCAINIIHCHGLHWALLKSSRNIVGLPFLLANIYLMGERYRGRRLTLLYWRGNTGWGVGPSGSCFLHNIFDWLGMIG